MKYQRKPTCHERDILMVQLHWLRSRIDIFNHHVTFDASFRWDDRLASAGRGAAAFSAWWPDEIRLHPVGIAELMRGGLLAPLAAALVLRGEYWRMGGFLYAVRSVCPNLWNMGPEAAAEKAWWDACDYVIDHQADMDELRRSMRTP